MSNQGRRILTHVAIIVIAFAAGACAGLILYPEVFHHDDAAHQTSHLHDDHDDHDDHGHDDHDHEVHEDDHHEEVLELTKAAAANLKLKLGKAQLGDHAKVQSYPGELVEIPGQSDLSVSAPVSGVIEFVSVRNGQSVGTGEALFDLRITDQQLTTAQSELLSLLSKIEIANAELSRLSPLVASGTVPEKRTRDLEYELRGLKAAKDTKLQEILARGLPRTTLDHVLATKQLASRISISVPNYQTRRVPSTSDFIKEVGLVPNERSYSIGSIHAHPGMAVKTGVSLCDLSYHGRLYIKGQAFESDLGVIADLSKSEVAVTAEFGHQHHGGHHHSVRQEDLLVTHIDNHVSTETQTFSFFLPIENDVLGESLRNDRLYRQWRFRPGQRVHLRAPVAKFSQKIKLPVEAVAVEGPNAYVFREHQHVHELGVPHEDHAYLEIEPVDVHVLHRDHQYAIIEPGELKANDSVAMNAAFKLQLAMRMAAGGGGGHHHDHDH